VLVVGYGRVGKLVGDMLGRHDLPWIAIERDARLVEQGRRNGRPHLLRRRLAAGTAGALRPGHGASGGGDHGRAGGRRGGGRRHAGRAPGHPIVVRARDARHAARLYELGATDAVPETIEASLQLSEAVLVDIGVPMGLVIASIHERRDEYRKVLNRPDALGGRRRRLRDASLR
jgi:CPA2 family monovalent cation:H+ antiporter-2